MPISAARHPNTNATILPGFIPAPPRPVQSRDCRPTRTNAARAEGPIAMWSPVLRTDSASRRRQRALRERQLFVGLTGIGVVELGLVELGVAALSCEQLAVCPLFDDP